MIDRRTFAEIKPDYYVMITALFFMKIGQFMSLPFLAIYLSHQLSPSLIGLVIGSGAFTYGMFGLASGLITDKIGVKVSLILALFIGGAALFCLFLIHNVLWYIAISIIIGISRSLFNVASRAYGIVDLPTPVRRLCFSLRNMSVDTAAAIGPLVGAYFATRHFLNIFHYIGFVYIGIGFISILILKNTGKGKQPVPLKTSLVSISQDRLLQMMMVIAFCYWLAYSQLDSVLPLYLNHSLKNGVQLYTWILVVGAAGCALLQLPMIHFTRNLQPFTQALIGMLLFAIAYALLGLTLSTPGLLLAALILVLAETIILPLNDTLVAHIAPSNQIATYYGAISLAAIGMGIGPFIGGLLYQHLNALSVFLICAVLCLVSLWFYWHITRRKNIINAPP